MYPSLVVSARAAHPEVPAVLVDLPAPPLCISQDGFKFLGLVPWPAHRAVLSSECRRPAGSHDSRQGSRRPTRLPVRQRICPSRGAGGLSVPGVRDSHAVEPCPERARPFRWRAERLPPPTTRTARCRERCRLARTRLRPSSLVTSTRPGSLARGRSRLTPRAAEPLTARIRYSDGPEPLLGSRPLYVCSGWLRPSCSRQISPELT